MAHRPTEIWAAAGGSGLSNLIDKLLMSHRCGQISARKDAQRLPLRNAQNCRLVFFVSHLVFYMFIILFPFNFQHRPTFSHFVFFKAFFFGIFAGQAFFLEGHEAAVAALLQDRVGVQGPFWPVWSVRQLGNEAVYFRSNGRNVVKTMPSAPSPSHHHFFLGGMGAPFPTGVVYDIFFLVTSVKRNSPFLLILNTPQRPGFGDEAILGTIRWVCLIFGGCGGNGVLGFIG